MFSSIACGGGGEPPSESTQTSGELTDDDAASSSGSESESASENGDGDGDGDGIACTDPTPISCGDECVDTTSNNLHCGTCNAPCGPG